MEAHRVGVREAHVYLIAQKPADATPLACDRGQP